MQLKFDAIRTNFRLFVAADEFARLAATVAKSVFLGCTATTFSKDCMPTDESSADTGRTTEINSQFYRENAVINAVFYYLFDFRGRQASHVTRYQRNLPGRKPPCTGMILPKDHCPTDRVCELTSARVCSR